MAMSNIYIYILMSNACRAILSTVHVNIPVYTLTARTLVEGSWALTGLNW